MINPKQFEKYVIALALQLLGMDSPSARALLLGTAAQESGLGTWLRQVGGGPAMGVFQMEPATFHDILDNFVKYHPEIQAVIAKQWPGGVNPELMITDLIFAAVMCRLHYRRVKESIPEAGDIQALARYWKAHYNTPAGAGTEAEFVHNWQQRVAGGK
ncbi:MAG: hypothetical protein HQL95_02250 [Magnetococcales bacterium]|nr:hypothetical protein [Magnetococcales bacterium]